MLITHRALTSMGFIPITTASPITASFSSLTVFRVIGVTDNESERFDPVGLLTAVEGLRFSLGSDLNALCRALANDDYDDDPQEWAKRHQAAPPYLLIQATLPTTYTVTSGFWTEQQGRFITHDTFVTARSDLRAFEKDKVSALVTALSLQLSTTNSRVSIIKLERIVYGTMLDGRNLSDLKFSFSGDAYLSSAITNTQVAASIKQSLNLVPNIHPKVGHFFASAAAEKDRLKKFLFLFHVLEINTHQTFAVIESSQHFVFPHRLCNSIQQYLEKTQDEAKNLVQRFLWCSILRWTSITDSDIEDFKLVKAYRDNLSHGHIIEDNELPIEKAYSLIYKVLND